MSVSICAVGYSMGSDRTRRAGCGIILTCKPDDKPDDNNHSDHGTLMPPRYRSMSFKLGSATVNAAHLKAAMVGLMAVRDKRANIVLYLDHYCLTMLSHVDGSYTATPSTNVEVVGALRAIYDDFGRPEIRLLKESQYRDDCLEMAKQAAIRQNDTDSGTVALQDAGPST